MIKRTLVILLTILTSGSAAIITTAPKKGSEGNRFLFIVDASSSMDRLEHAGRQVVFDLIYSGIEGRMQAGDTFGIWTFGKDVKAGVFPMQTWHPDQSTDLAGKAGRFLKEQSSGRKGNLAAAIAKAESLAKAVQDVDIVIVTSAAASFKEDDTWGVLQQEWKRRLEEARKSKKAIIFAFAARGGRMAQATLTLEGERLQLAAPPERKSAQQAAARQAPAPEPAPKIMREPIIMRGTPKPRPIEAVPTKFAPPPLQAPPVEQVVDPLPEPAPVPVLKPEKPIVMTPEPVTKNEEPVVLPTPGPAPELTVAAREPGRVTQSSTTRHEPVVSGRMLIVAGAALMLIAGLLGGWILLHARSRARLSYISRSMAEKH